MMSIPLPCKALADTRAALASIPGGRTVAAWLDPAAGPDAWADARTAAWEQLHTGPWREVPGVWRDAYGAACVLGARALLLLLLENEEAEAEETRSPPPPATASDCPPLAALDLADRVLMMGGPAFHAAAHALVAVAEGRLASAAAALVAALPPAWPAPNAPPPLPPGSLNTSPPSTRIPASPPGSLPSLVAFAGAHLPSPAHPHGAPVVLTGLAAAWPALSAWATPSGLVTAVGPYRTVPVELGAHYLAEGWGQRLQRFGEFVRDGMASQNLDNTRCPYLAQHDLLAQVPALRAGIVTPDYCALSTATDGGGGDDDDPPPPPTTNVWFGPAGTVSPPHTDPHANILVQVLGTKYVRLYGPECGAAGLAPGATAAATATDATDALLTNTSRVDLAALAPSPGAPGVAGLPFLDAVLHPGDALFIPRGWWHYVQALEPSASVSFWWD